MRTRSGFAAGLFVLGKQLCYADVALYDCITAIWVSNIHIIHVLDSSTTEFDNASTTH